MDYVKYYLDHFFKPLSQHPHLSIAKAAMPKRDKNATNKYERELPEALRDFYHQINGVAVRWSIDQTNLPEAGGSVNILPLHHLFDETVVPIASDLVVIDDELDFAKKTKIEGVFRRVDLFTDEASVGYFSDPQMGKKLFYAYGHRFYHMNLDFAGYFKLLCAAKGYIYWQHVILYTEYAHGKIENEQFRAQMPLIFSDFKWDDFIKLYQDCKQS